MMAFSELSGLARNLLQLWAVLCSCLGLICIIYAIWQKQYRYALATAPCFLIAYFLQQVMSELSNPRHPANEFCQKLGQFAWPWEAVVLGFVSVAIATILYFLIRYNHHHIHRGSIMLCADSMPCGICYYRDGGKVIFANDCMSELCFQLIGAVLQNGEEFYDAICEPILQIGDEMWSFTSRTVEFKGAPLHELIAANVTELYEKTASLKAENEELIRYNEMLRDYYLHIDETVRHQELLQAKVEIHDEMNKIMLTTVASGGDGGCDVDDAFMMWKNNALLLSREAADEKRHSIIDLEQIASALHMKLVWVRDLPEEFDERKRSLFFKAAKEAIANAFKHAGAKELKIDFNVTEKSVRCTFENDGTLPKTPVVYTGGLKNLERFASYESATMEVEIQDRFTLSLELPRKNTLTGGCENKK